MQPEDKIRKADDVFFEIFRDFDVFHFLNPVNHLHEREQFLESWREGRRYNPTFEYNPLPDDVTRWKHRLQAVDLGVSELELLFHEVRQDLMGRLELLEARGSEAVTKISSRLFGTPSTELIDQAYNALKRSRRGKEDEETDVGVKGLTEQLKEHLRSDQIEGWDVVEDPHTLALAQVDWGHHKIRLQPGLLVSQPMAERLLAHEIEVHVYRAANGERQPYKTFAIGFDGYLPTEEGLAVELEEKLGLLGPMIRLRYAGRVLSAANAVTGSFFEVFNAMAEFFSPEEAFTLAVRCKRGLKRTTQPGGLIIDHIYLAGQKMIEQLSDQDIRLLYTGRIAVSHLPLVKDLIAKKKLFEPAFVPSVYHG